jgi:hypothetical protein
LDKRPAIKEQIKTENSSLLKLAQKLAMVEYACNPSTWDAKSGGLRFQDQLALQSNTLSQKPKQETKSDKNKAEKSAVHY